MNKPLVIPSETARRISLSAQGLCGSPARSGTRATLGLIAQLGYVQIDTLSVVARAHHHCLWSRQPAYKEESLAKLLANRSIFEYWSHAASYLPMSEYRFSLPRKQTYREGGSHWFAQDKKMQRYVLDRIRSEGPLASKDFEFKRSGPGNWYEWKPAKKALEQLFMEGRLMVTKRQGFQKVYDLAENVLPPDVDQRMPEEKEYAQFLVRKAITSHGLVREAEVAYLRKGLKGAVAAAIKQLLKEWTIREVRVEGLPGVFYSDADLPSLPRTKKDGGIHILSPFDNLLIQRKRIQELFGFDYNIECYLPEAKRKYGYFTLPVLDEDRFVARFDPKADRAEKIFYIRSMHFEKGFYPDERFNARFAQKLQQFAAFNGCEKIVIDKADRKWKKEMRGVLI